MRKSKDTARLIERRSEILVELFLFQQLGASFVARPSTDFGVDLLAAFPNTRGGMNLWMVEVKSGKLRKNAIPVSQSVLSRLALSNVSALLVHANAKTNELAYTEVTEDLVSKSKGTKLNFVKLNPIGPNEVDSLRALVVR